MPNELNALNYIQFGVIIGLMFFMGLWRSRALNVDERLAVTSWGFLMSVRKSLLRDPRIVGVESALQVSSLDNAKAIVKADPLTVTYVFEYKNTQTYKKIYVVDCNVNAEAKHIDGHVLNRVVYSSSLGWL